MIFITAKDKTEADKLAKGLVENRLAACVNVVTGVNSFFRWQGKLQRAREALLIVKSGRERFKDIVRFIKSKHSYEVPEIIAVPIVRGEKKYLEWLDESLR